RRADHHPPVIPRGAHHGLVQHVVLPGDPITGTNSHTRTREPVETRGHHRSKQADNPPGGRMVECNRHTPTRVRPAAAGAPVHQGAGAEPPGGMDTARTDVYAPGLPWQQQWYRFFPSHPEVLTTHRYRTGSPPACACPDCDPRGMRPDAEIAVMH